jgi:hypothetical protein
MVYRKEDLETSIISKNTQEVLGDRFLIRGSSHTDVGWSSILWALFW